MKKLVLVMVFALLGGCSNNYVVQQLSTPDKMIGRDAGVYVMRPEDGRYGTTVYAASGWMTAQAVQSALLTKVQDVRIGSKPETLEAALQNAKEQKMSHVFEPVILLWEDRATAWSGIPDKIMLKFTVYDVSTSEAVASTTVQASSKIATLETERPQDLLPVPIQTFVKQVF